MVHFVPPKNIFYISIIPNITGGFKMVMV